MACLDGEIAHNIFLVSGMYFYDRGSIVTISWEFSSMMLRDAWLSR